MRRSILVLMVLMLLLPAAALKADQAAWSPVRIIVQGYRNVSALVEASLALVNAYHPQPGTSVHITSGLGGWDFTELYIKLSAPGGSYAYLLEVWTKRLDGWHKAMEYSYDDASAGQIVFHPFAIDSGYAEGNMHRVEFQHSVSQRQMTLFSQYAVPVSGAAKSIGVALEQADYVDIYFTAHLDTSLGGAATNDAYLFGARIAKAEPHLCTARQGLYDQGSVYDFKLYNPVVDVPANNGYFNATNGFVIDAQSSNTGYPDASGVDPANLPDSAAVSSVSVSFASTADPVF